LGKKGAPDPGKDTACVAQTTKKKIRMLSSERKKGKALLRGGRGKCRFPGQEWEKLPACLQNNYYGKD